MFDIVRLKAIIILPQRKEHKTMSKENKLKKFVKNEGCQYFKYAMLSFGGLGLEGIYAYLLEPLFYGHSINEFTTPEWILHWSITIITWLMVAYLIIRSARNNLNFQLKGINSKWTPVGIIASCILIGLMVVSNFIDLGQLKIVHEFQALGILKFVFQHLYYLAEVILFMLIIVFGQKGFENLFSASNIPYGGILVGLTWGLAHWVTKGSIWIGLGGTLLGFLFGTIYLFLGRDLKKTYLVLALTFII